MAANFKNQGRAFEWYNNELLEMAKDVGYRLLPAFNTTTGIPYPRVSVCSVLLLTMEGRNTVEFMLRESSVRGLV